MTARPLAVLAAVLVTTACDERRTLGDDSGAMIADTSSEEEAPPSHEGEPCPDAIGEVEECSVDGELGYEVCAENPEVFAEFLWSACNTDLCDEAGTSRTCDLGGGATGYQACGDLGGGALVWGACAAPECTPGQTAACGGPDDPLQLSMGCVVGADGMPHWNYEDCNTPLVLSFDGRAPEFAAPTAAAAAFDVSGAGACASTDWPSARTPWLALDLDRSGTIDGGHELFGNGSRLAAGGRARNGFDALAELDADGDRRITAADPAFVQLLLWTDHDAERRSNAWELQPIADLGLVAIDLDYRAAAECDARGNCGNERAPFTFRRGDQIVTGEVVDVYLACD